MARKPLSRYGETATAATRLSPEDQVMVKWIADATGFSSSHILRLAMRHLALTAAGTGPDRDLDLDDPARLIKLAISELISEIESKWHGMTMTLIASDLDQHGRYIGKK